MKSRHDGVEGSSNHWEKASVMRSSKACVEEVKWNSVAFGRITEVPQGSDERGDGGSRAGAGRSGGTCVLKSLSLISALVIEERRFLERSLWPPGQNCRLPKRAEMWGNGPVICPAQPQLGPRSFCPRLSAMMPSSGDSSPCGLSHLIPHPQPRGGHKLQASPYPSYLSNLGLGVHGTKG